MMTFDPASLLTKAELREPRTPKELFFWVDGKCRLFSEHREAREWGLLRRGLSQNFHEEVFPFSRWAAQVYGDRADVKCAFTLDNTENDAIVLDYSIRPTGELRAEITSAVANYEEYLRMKCFVEHGSVSVWGRVTASGSERQGHEIAVENGMIAHSELLERTCEGIKKAAEGKANKPNKPPRYGRGYILLIVFDDWQWFKAEKDVVALRGFVEEQVMSLPLNFDRLYTIGYSGNTCECFSLSSNTRNREDGS